MSSANAATDHTVDAGVQRPHIPEAVHTLLIDVSLRLDGVVM